MVAQQQPRRTRLVVCCIVGCWIALLCRVADLQLAGEQFRAVANSQRTRSVKVPANTGRILDRDGRPLAVSIRQPSVFVDPSRIDDPDRFADQVAPVLKLDGERLAVSLKKHVEHKFRWLRRRVDSAIVDDLEQLQLSKGSWGTRDEFRRVYPQGRVAAQILGLRGLDGQATAGIESLFSAEIEGVSGARRLVSDARGRPLQQLSELSQAPRPGRDIRLTLDARLSIVVGKRLDELMDYRQPTWAAAIVIDPRNGELISAESRPSYDPNNPVEISTGSFNHAFDALFEPGSVVKPLIFASALAAGRVGTNDVIDCGPGRAVVAGRPMRDAGALGAQPLKTVLAKSSNIGAARVAERLGRDGLHDCLATFGFGSPVPTNFFTPVSGRLRPTSEWSGYSIGSLAMGHEVSVTPLHLASAYASLVSGRLIRPRLIRQSGELVEQSRQLWEPRISKWIVEDALGEVVRSGTGKSLRIDGVDVFGKTGTAQKYDAEEGRYRTDRATCVVVAGAPANAPTRLVVVVVDDPSVDPPFGGGRVAGPVARDILDEALRFVD